MIEHLLATKVHATWDVSRDNILWLLLLTKGALLMLIAFLHMPTSKFESALEEVETPRPLQIASERSIGSMHGFKAI